MYIFDCRFSCDALTANLNTYLDNFSAALIDLKRKLNLDILEIYRQFALPVFNNSEVEICIVISAYTKEELSEVIATLPLEFQNCFNVIDIQFTTNSSGEFPLTEAAQDYLANKYGFHFNNN